LQLFAEMQRRGLEADVITFSAVISACEKGKQPEQALQLFEEMRRRVLEPDVITFSAVISAREKGKQPEQALQFFEEMRRRCLEPGVITYTDLVVSFSSSHMWNWKLNLVDAFFSEWIDMFDVVMEPQNGQVVAQLAFSVGGFGGRGAFPPSLLSTTCYGAQLDHLQILISTFGKGQQAEQALELLKAVLRHGVAPNVITFSARCHHLQRCNQRLREGQAA